VWFQTCAAIVEDPRLLRIVRRGLDDRLQPLVGKGGVLDQVVQVRDVSLMMLAVMELESPGRNVRLERGLVVGQRWEFKSHDDPSIRNGLKSDGEAEGRRETPDSPPELRTDRHAAPSI
jgi:hypothetical protein